jgi:hypothetical protein
VVEEFAPTVEINSQYPILTGDRSFWPKINGASITFSVVRNSRGKTLEAQCALRVAPAHRALRQQSLMHHPHSSHHHGMQQGKPT